MEDYSLIELEKKIEIVNSGELPANVASKTFVAGPDILRRGDPYLLAQKVYDQTFINWPKKMSMSHPGPISTGYDICNRKQFSGINFATQDYMSLCYNPSSINAAVEAYKAYGSHSGGSPLFFGKNPYYFAVLDSLKKAFTRVMPDPHATIFSTGWMAGFGVVSALAARNDHIIMDALSHNCLQEGAKASHAKIHKVEHLNNDAMCNKIAEVREKNPNSGIVVVTEGLFSMDSDCPDLDRLQKICKANNAVLVIDSAHDMFCVGKKGLGNPGEKLTDWENVVILGSGSKALASNFGWVVSNNPALPAYFNYFSGSFTFSNALAPAVAATVKHNIDLLMSEEGDRRRTRCLQNSNHIRKRITDAGFEVIGEPSPIVVVPIGSEFVSRTLSHMMLHDGVILNSVEFPACAVGDSRLRLQIQSDHTKEHLDTFVDKLVAFMPKVEELLAKDQLSVVTQQKILEAFKQQVQDEQKL